jgi:hypothetical protein
MIRNDNIRESVDVTLTVEKMVEYRLRWFGHVERRSIDFIIRRVDKREDSQITRGRGGSLRKI